MKTYKEFINEGLINKMVAKSDEQINKSFNELSDLDKIEVVINNQLPDGLLPKNLIVTGELNLSHKELTSLPDNLDGLTVNGKLDLSFNELTSLPNNMTINGDLVVIGNPLNSLPNNLVVTGNFLCTNNKLTSLPDDLVVDGWFYCGGNQLPKNIKKPIGVKHIRWE